MRIELNSSSLKRLLKTADIPIASNERNYDCTSVFLLLYRKGNESCLLAILKADTPGYAWRNQVALPGGHVDEKDNSALEAAYRELAEEIGITQSQVEFIGSLGHFQTIQQKDIEVFLGLWEGRVENLVYDPQEISKILEIPLGVLLNTHVLKEFQGHIPNIEKLIYPFEDMIIWGVTARIFHYFFELLLKNTGNTDIEKLRKP